MNSNHIMQELYLELQQFPSPEQIRSVCKSGQGELACRFLVLDDGTPRCGKTSPIREQIDRRTREGTLSAKGDNCQGILTLIRAKHASFIGRPVHYEESMPTMTERGVLNGLEFTDDTILLNVAWESGIEYAPRYSSASQITVAEDGITFANMGLGTLAGQTTIL